MKSFAAKGSPTDFWWQQGRKMNASLSLIFDFVYKSQFSREAHCLTGMEIELGHIHASLMSIWSIFLPGFLWHP